MIRSIVLAAVLLGTSAVSGFASADEKLDAVIASPHRTPANVARDPYRHPAEVLRFFGLKADMKVAEIWPGGGGYFSEILAPYLMEKGEYSAVVATLHATSDYQKNANSALFSKFGKSPAAFAKVKLADVNKGDYDFAAPDSLDMIFTFRNLHNWMMGGYDKPMLKAFYEALKPGGRLAVVDHRLDGSPYEAKQIWGGYISQAHMIASIEAAGFKLHEASEINANPKDTKNYEKGVWTLPPTYSLGEMDRAKYEAIGESDRATLIFVK